MTITTTEDTVQQLGNGVTTEVPYPYTFFEKSDLVVVATDINTLDNTTLVLDTDYTIPEATTSQGYPNGENITLVSAPSSDTRITVYRELPFTQSIDYPEGDAFPSKTHERGLDKLTLLAQQVYSKIRRSIKLGLTSTFTGDLTITEDPIPGRAMKFAEDGVSIVNTNADIDTVIDLAQAAIGSLPGGSAALSFLRRNAANSALEYRTPAQTRSDISAITMDEAKEEIDKDIIVLGNKSTDFSLTANRIHTAAITDNCTLALPTISTTTKYVDCMIEFSLASGKTLTLPTVKWDWGYTPTFSTTTKNLVMFRTTDNGTTWRASYIQEGA